MTKKSKKAASKIKPKKTKNKGGRPSPYDKKYIKMAYVACSEAGFSNSLLAKLFGVGTTTIERWRNKYKRFDTVIKKGRDVFDTNRVKSSLLKRATGFRYTETTRELPAIQSKDLDDKNAKGESNLIVTKKVSKKVVPDTKACIFWLSKRDPKEWPSEKQLLELSSPEGEGLFKGITVTFIKGDKKDENS